MKTLLTTLLLLAFSISARAEQQPWSEAVNGLRARFCIERTKDSPFLKIFLEIQNTSDVMGIKTIRFTSDSITPAVTNKADKELQRANGPYDGASPIWTPLKLPFEGAMRFRINFPGLGYDPESDNAIIDMGPLQSWSIPENGEWYLSGSLKIEKQQGDHPYMDWNGTLSLPKVRIPQESKEGEDGGGPLSNMPALSPAQAQRELQSVTPERLVAEFVTEVSALAKTYPELDGFPEYAITRSEPLDVVYSHGLRPIRTKRGIRPSDFDSKGIHLQFMLRGADNPVAAQSHQITDLPNLHLTLFADVALTQDASDGLETKLRALIEAHKALLERMDKETANN